MRQYQAILQDIGLNPSEIEVFFSIIQGARSARDIINATNIKRPTAYYAINSLARRGLISESGAAGSKKFSPAPLLRLRTIAHEEKRRAEEAEDKINALIPALERMLGKESARPAISLYEGKSSVTNIIMETIFCRTKHIDTVVPKQNFFWQMGEPFVTRYVSARKKEEITTRSLWETPVGKNVINAFYKGFSQIRIMPKSMHNRFTTTVFMYDDSVLFIAPAQDAHCLLMNSKEYAETMRAWFDGLWERSTPHVQ